MFNRENTARRAYRVHAKWRRLQDMLDHGEIMSELDEHLVKEKLEQCNHIMRRLTDRVMK